MIRFFAKTAAAAAVAAALGAPALAEIGDIADPATAAASYRNTAAATLGLAPVEVARDGARHGPTFHGRDVFGPRFSRRSAAVFGPPKHADPVATAFHESRRNRSLEGDVLTTKVFNARGEHIGWETYRVDQFGRKRIIATRDID